MLHVPLIHFIQFKSVKITRDTDEKSGEEEKKNSELSSFVETKIHVLM